MDILRFLALDVGPYFGVFMVLVAVIGYQMKLIVTILDIKTRVEKIENGDQEKPTKK